MTGLESLAYSIARGVARAWFEELAVQKLAEREVIEVPNDLDRARRFRDAVARLRSEQDAHTGSERPASGS